MRRCSTGGEVGMRPGSSMQTTVRLPDPEHVAVANQFDCEREELHQLSSDRQHDKSVRFLLCGYLPLLG